MDFLFVLLIILVSYSEGTCFDSKKDGAEKGVDCGGDCLTACDEYDEYDEDYGFDEWNAWGAFGPCTADCGGGTRQRNRTCNGDDCNGDPVDTINCNTESCPTTEAPLEETCEDGIQNQDEDGIDCGGACYPNYCAPATGTCFDGKKNQDEVGVDCGGGTCYFNDCALVHMPTCAEPEADGDAFAGCTGRLTYDSTKDREENPSIATCCKFAPTCGEVTDGGGSFTACEDNRLYNQSAANQTSPSEVTCCKGKRQVVCQGHYGTNGDEEAIAEPNRKWCCPTCNCKDLNDYELCNELADICLSCAGACMLGGQCYAYGGIGANIDKPVNAAACVASGGDTCPGDTCAVAACGDHECAMLMLGNAPQCTAYAAISVDFDAFVCKASGGTPCETSCDHGCVGGCMQPPSSPTLPACKAACHRATSGPCQHDAPDDFSCFGKNELGNCPAGTTECQRDPGVCVMGLDTSACESGGGTVCPECPLSCAPGCYREGVCLPYMRSPEYSYSPEQCSKDGGLLCGVTPTEADLVNDALDTLLDQLSTAFIQGGGNLSEIQATAYLSKLSESITTLTDAKEDEGTGSPTPVDTGSAGLGGVLDKVANITDQLGLALVQNAQIDVPKEILTDTMSILAVRTSTLSNQSYELQGVSSCTFPTADVFDDTVLVMVNIKISNPGLTDVLSVTVNRNGIQVLVQELDEPIVMGLTNATKPGYSAMCVWWNVADAKWDDEGCTTEGGGSCSCDHLTDFAIMYTYLETGGCEQGSIAYLVGVVVYTLIAVAVGIMFATQWATLSANMQGLGGLVLACSLLRVLVNALRFFPIACANPSLKAFVVAISFIPYCLNLIAVSFIITLWATGYDAFHDDSSGDAKTHILILRKVMIGVSLGAVVSIVIALLATDGEERQQVMVVGVVTTIVVQAALCAAAAFYGYKLEKALFSMKKDNPLGKKVLRTAVVFVSLLLLQTLMNLVSALAPASQEVMDVGHMVAEVVGMCVVINLFYIQRSHRRKSVKGTSNHSRTGRNKGQSTTDEGGKSRVNPRSRRRKVKEGRGREKRGSKGEAFKPILVEARASPGLPPRSSISPLGKELGSPGEELELGAGEAAEWAMEPKEKEKEAKRTKTKTKRSKTKSKKRSKSRRSVSPVEGAEDPESKEAILRKRTEKMLQKKKTHQKELLKKMMMPSSDDLPSALHSKPLLEPSANGSGNGEDSKKKGLGGSSGSSKKKMRGMASSMRASTRAPKK